MLKPGIVADPQAFSGPLSCAHLHPTRMEDQPGQCRTGQMARPAHGRLAKYEMPNNFHSPRTGMRNAAWSKAASTIRSRCTGLERFCGPSRCLNSISMHEAENERVIFQSL